MFRCNVLFHRKLWQMHLVLRSSLFIWITIVETFLQDRNYTKLKKIRNCWIPSHFRDMIIWLNMITDLTYHIPNKLFSFSILLLYLLVSCFIEKFHTKCVCVYVRCKLTILLCIQTKVHKIENRFSDLLRISHM